MEAALLKFNADLFRIATVCQSNEQTRYYLVGVFVEPRKAGGVTLTATDVSRLVCIYDETGTADESAIVSLTPDAFKACKTGKHETRREIEIDGPNATIYAVTGAGENETRTPVAFSNSCRVDGTFPDYRRVIPKIDIKPDSRPGNFNGALLADFGKIATELAKLRGQKTGQVRLMSFDPTMPAMVQLPNAPAFGVLMPMRGEQSDTMPDWYETREQVSAD